MTISLHTQTSAPNITAATSVSPLVPSGSSKTKFSRGKSKARAGAVKTDLYQTVTDSIIAALELSPALFPAQFPAQSFLRMTLMRSPLLLQRPHLPLIPL